MKISRIGIVSIFIILLSVSCRSGEDMSAYFDEGRIENNILVKSIVTEIAKGGIKMLGKSYSSWSSYRRLYGKQGFAEPNQHLHHWLWKRNGASSGEGFDWWAKNQMWNLKPVPKVQGMSYDAVHKAIEGKGLSDWSMMRRLYYGTPSWPWSFSVSSGGRLIDINNE